MIPLHPKLFIRRDGKFELAADFFYRWRMGDSFGTRVIHVPAGTVTDLASVPRWLWWLICRFELGLAAPLIHDWIYSNAGRIGGDDWTRKDADRLFGRIMREEGVPRWKRRSGFIAVRLIGWIHWKIRE